MIERKADTVRDLIYWSYANLAMAHSAVIKKQESYVRFNFMIRSRLYKGLTDGTMNLRSIFDDEKIKLQTGQFCNYCGSAEKLALDHVFPRHSGGQDAADNLVFACRTCNSSKGKKDLMEWMQASGKFLPLMIIRRYLKLCYYFCQTNELLDKKVEELKGMPLPVKVELLPVDFPQPGELVMGSVEIQ